MRRAELHTPYVLEWSPRGLTLYNGNTGSAQTVSSFAEVAGHTREVIVALSRRIVFIRTVRVPNAGTDEVRQILKLRMADLFPVAVQDLAYDFTFSNDTNAEGRLALVVAVPTSELSKVINEAKSAGVKIARIVPVALGSVGLIGDGSTAAIVEHSIDGSSIDVVSDGVLRQSRVVGSLNLIGAEVARTFNLAGVGGGAIVSAGGLALSEANQATKESSLSSIYRSQGSISINVELPDVIEARKRSAKSSRVRIAGMMWVAAILMGLYVFYQYQDANSSAVASKTQSEKLVKQAEKQAQAAEEQLAHSKDVAAELDRGFHPAQSFADLATLVANVAPSDSLWLTGINLDRGKDLTVRGTARTADAVAKYLDALSTKTDDRLRNVRPVAASESQIDTNPVVQFSVSAFPVGNLPLIDAESKAKGGQKK